MEETCAYILKLSKVRGELIKDTTRPEPSWVRITTITMISKFQKEIDIPKFRENFAKLENVHVRSVGTTGPGFIWHMKETAFYNQVTIGYADAYSRKSIKIFPNGSIQVAGCSDLFDCRRVLAQLSFIVKVVLELEEQIPTEPPAVKMINTNFSLNSSVNLHKIIDKLKKGPFKVAFDPDRYSAVKVKFVPGPDMKQVTASIFSTGRIIVTGAQTLAEIAGAYEILNKNIESSMFIKKVDEPEMFEVVTGAKFGEWVRAIKNVI